MSKPKLRLPVFKTVLCLPNPDKKAFAQVLVEEGYTMRQISDYLGASSSTICRWVNEELEAKDKEKVEQKKERFRAQLAEMKVAALANSINRLNELVPKSQDIFAVIKAAEYLESKQDVSQTNIQVNFNNLRNEQKEKYGL